MNEWLRARLIPALGVILALYTLCEVNYPQLQSQSRLAVFGLLGIVLCYLIYPVSPRFKDNTVLKSLDLVWALLTVLCFGYVIVQSEPAFKSMWALGQSLGDRARIETNTDLLVGAVGLLLVLEATRRSIGWALPLLAVAFIAHAYFGEHIPDLLLPHPQMKPDRIVAVTFLQSLGVFGPASKVMFTYVFLFVVFGAFLEVTGATQFIVNFAEAIFGRSPGGPAKVSVLGSGLMGSLSGSAVANAVTTGTFTIPMMRNAGFQPHVAGGITAAAASGGALVPPVMGAGAYMMLEIVEPQVTFLQVARAALIPAILYYFSILMIVHFYAGRTGTIAVDAKSDSPQSLLSLMLQFEGVVFFGALGSLVGFLFVGYSPFRAVTYALGVIVALGLVHPRQRLTPKMALDALTKAARNGVSLVSASACVGIIIGIVQTTGIAGEFNHVVKGVVEESLLLALIGIMCCSIVLGMGVPSVVCYLLMATLMGSLLKELGVIPLAAHLFIFYFGMMSMVTPPVALAAFASASIAGANIMRTGLSAFLFSLVGFTLPFMFVYRPELLLLSNKPEIENWSVLERQGEVRNVQGRLTHIGEPVPDTTLECTRLDSQETLTVVTNSSGGFRLPPEAATWKIAYLDREEDSQAVRDGPAEAADADDDVRREVLGEFTYNPTAADNDDPAADEQFVFRDQRLSWIQVMVATVTAAFGIVALAAGIAGYMRRPLPIVLRVAAFAAAGLLLFPGEGMRFGDVSIGILNVAGLCILVGIDAFGRVTKDDAAAVSAGT